MKGGGGGGRITFGFSGYDYEALGYAKAEVKKIGPRNETDTKVMTNTIVTMKSMCGANEALPSIFAADMCRSFL